MAAMSWLCRRSLCPSWEARRGSICSLNSAWLRRPVQTLLARQLQWGECAMDWGRRTDQELSDGLFVDGPSFGADVRLERRVYGFEVDARRYDLACFWFL